MDTRKYDDPARSTRGWITVALVVGGAVAGALIGIAITPLGKIVAGAPPADFANYRWNAISLGIMGAIGTPLFVWSGMRSVPLWRAVLEPLAGAIAGAAIGVALGSAAAFLALTPLGLAAAATRLAWTRGRARRTRALNAQRNRDFRSPAP